MISRKTAASARRPKLSYDERVSSILSKRERRMNEILSLHHKGAAPGSFADKAHALLTLRWSKANWRSRENILRTVDWLLRMERVNQSVSAARTGLSGIVAGRVR